MTAYLVRSAKDGRVVTVCALCASNAELDVPSTGRVRDRRTGATVELLAPGERIGRHCAGCNARLALPALEQGGYPCWRCDELFDPLTTTGSVYCPACHPLYLEHRAILAAEQADRLAHANAPITP